jgi:hypothetical protein
MLDSICSNELADPDELISSEPMLCEASIRQRCCPKDRSLADWSPPPPTLSLLVISLYLCWRKQGQVTPTRVRAIERERWSGSDDGDTSSMAPTPPPPCPISHSAASMPHLPPRRLYTSCLHSIARYLIG